MTIMNDRKRGGDMVIDWTPIITKYKGQWVALGSDEKTVVAHGKNIKIVYANASKKIDNPLMFKVPSGIVPYIG